MIEYDKYYQNSETDLLLLNIARLDQGDSPHFTILTSINNSISFGGVLSSQVSFSSGANNLAKNTFQAGPFSAAMSETPLFSLVPIQGQDFSNRFYTPLTDKFALFMLRDYSPNPLLLLMGDYLFVTRADKSVPNIDKCVRRNDEYWCDNDPLKPFQQNVFWNVVNRLGVLKESHSLYMYELSPDLDADEVLEESSTPPTATEFEAAAKDGYRWAAQAGKPPYRLIRPANSSDKMFAMFDYPADDPKDKENYLSDEKKVEIMEHVQPDPQNFVYVDLQTTPPLKIKGYIKIRTFIEILEFLSSSLHSTSTTAMFPDGSPRAFIGGGRELPEWFRTSVTDNVSFKSLYYRGTYVWLPASRDSVKRDEQVFSWLYKLYQLSVVATSRLPLIPVTIPTR